MKIPDRKIGQPTFPRRSRPDCPPPRRLTDVQRRMRRSIDDGLKCLPAGGRPVAWWKVGLRLMEDMLAIGMTYDAERGRSTLEGLPIVWVVGDRLALLCL